jgi:tRNA pseudouridine38-40 synthase
MNSPPLYRYFIKFSYNGTHYHGWQMQPNAKTVQEVLDLNISLIQKHKIESVGAGRTDTGVHASCMFAHFDTSFEIKERSQFVFKINRMLPEDISVYEVKRVLPNAHARFDALSRTYKYYIHQFKDVFCNDYSLFIYGLLDLEAMNKACEILIKQNDFACFSKTNTDVKTTFCSIETACWERQTDNQLVFTIKANRFLRNMVRAIVGTLLDIGQKKLSIDDFKVILESKKRSMAGQSVAAKALFLSEIIYPEHIFMNE